MDFISHAIFGKLFQTSSKLSSIKDKALVIIFSILPDLPVLFVYLLLGRANNRPFLIPYNSDWIGVRQTHPWWSAAWEIPHSIFFIILIVTPLIYYMNWPKIAVASYSFHVVLDLFSHTGEWAIKPFYPINYVVDGFTDAWAWPLSYMILSWGILVSCVLVAKIITKTEKTP